MRRIDYFARMSIEFFGLKEEFQELLKKYDILGAKIYKFTQYVSKNWNNPLEPKTNN